MVDVAGSYDVEVGDVSFSLRIQCRKQYSCSSICYRATKLAVLKLPSIAGSEDVVFFGVMSEVL